MSQHIQYVNASRKALRWVCRVYATFPKLGSWSIFPLRRIFWDKHLTDDGKPGSHAEKDSEMVKLQALPVGGSQSEELLRQKPEQPQEVEETAKVLR